MQLNEKVGGLGRLRRLRTPKHPIFTHQLRKSQELTLASLIMAGITGLLIGKRQFLWAALALLILGLCDSFDGELARFNQGPTRLGAFIDSISDHLICLSVANS